MDSADVKRLFKGVALIVDDKVSDSDSSIAQIMKNFENENIPLIKYDILPRLDIISHLQNISFVLFDWQLQTMELGVSTPSELQNSNDDDNLNFLEKLIQNCFCPIFIFSDLPEEDIKEKLKGRELYNDSRMNMFFIKQKNDIKDANKLFDEMGKWIETNSSMYLLKEWDNAYQKAKSELFVDFQNVSSTWANLLWKNFKDDDEDFSTPASISFELFDVLMKNITNRINVPKLNESILGIKATNEKEFASIIEKTKFIDNFLLNKDSPNTGDIFFCKDEKAYFINIRPQCDILRVEDPELYCLRGIELNLTPAKKHSYKDNNTAKPYDFYKGEFIEQKNNCIVSFVCNEKILEFRFKDLEILHWNEIKDKRVGKLLPPFITHIRQKYATYIEREGLPRIPDELLEKYNNSPSQQDNTR